MSDGKNYLVGARVCLRAMEPEDLDVLYGLENDPEMWDISNFSSPYSRYAIRQYIASSQCDLYADRQLRLMVELHSTGVVLGTADITDFVPRHGRGEVGIAMLSAYRGQGYATETLDLLCGYAFGFLGLHQLTAHVASGNEASLRLFKACGFVPCGLLRQWWRSSAGHYADVVLMQRLSDGSIRDDMDCHARC